LRNILFAALAVLLLLLLLGFLLRHYLRARGGGRVTWDDLLKRLAWVDRDNIAQIALDAIDASGNKRQDTGAFSLEPSAVWSLLGGLEGLKVLEQNCQVLVEMATYLQRWYPEALVVAEQMRLNAREIEWHVNRLRGAAQTGNLQASFADYAQRAVVTYYLMTRHLLALYEHASAPQFVELQRAL
jgi:hypothetical protein